MKLYFSPCPNDTFIFHAMLHNMVDTEGLRIDATIADISALNKIVIDGSADAAKISFAVYPIVKKCYSLLNYGSALGYGSGPLLVVARPQIVLNADSIVAIPGEHTTAALLMRSAFPQVRNYVPMLFSDIPAATKSAKVSAGVLIHESRFTYSDYGLHLLADLGVWWEQRFHLPLPLGGIALRRTLPLEERRAFARTMRRSVNYAIQNPHTSRAFVKYHAQELDNEVIDKHIKMFVNNYTQSLGAVGQQAVRQLLSVADSTK